MTKVNPSILSDIGWLIMLGAVVGNGWFAAAAGPNPPRLPLPDLHAVCLVGAAGPDSGQFMGPFSAFNLFQVFVPFMAFEHLDGGT